MMSADSDDELWLALGNYMSNSRKRERLGSSYLKLGMFSSMPKIVMSRARVGFMSRLQI